MRELRRLFFAILLVLLPALTAAQGIGPQLPGTVTASAAIDFEEWHRVATRTERAAESGVASIFALERMRAELVGWRDKFLAGEAVNAQRISTVRAQIAALGAKPENGLEDPSISARRSELEAQLMRLRAPVVLATEAYAQASGLISEIDRLIRERETARITTRGPSPLNPDNWMPGVMAVWTGVKAMWAETTTSFRSDLSRGDIWRHLPLTIAYAAVAFVLLWREEKWITALQGVIKRRERRGAQIWTFLVSLGEIALPFVGILAVVASAKAFDVLGFRTTMLIEALPEASLFVIVGRWMGWQFFSDSSSFGQILSFDEQAGPKGRRALLGLGWSLAAATLLQALISAADNTSVAGPVVLLPVNILVGWFLFRLGGVFVRNRSLGDAAPTFRDRALSVVGRVCMVLAVAGPVLSAAGYSAASGSLLMPAVMSLALLALVLLLHSLFTEAFAVMTRAEEKASEALTPVLVGIGLVLLSLPVIALIWGAKVVDLIEVWQKFREGFSVGESRISPTDFITFAIVFAVVYMATRLVQGTLRTTVLPRTRMDIGAQNAIVSGFGYIGIFLAALAAITSAGIDLSSLAIVAGALSVGIGFGLQNIVSNFVSGIILLIERPISEGDWIEVGGQMGYVRDISVRSTRIETFDRSDVIVPNADLVSGQVINWTRGNLIGRVIVPVGVAYGTDTEKVTKILREIAEAHPMVLATPAPNVMFQTFGADSLNFEIRAILRDVNYVGQVRSEMNHEIAKRFAEEGIEIPFAQRDIWLRNPEALRDAFEKKSK
jgi:potassium efflux system protein